MTKSFHFFLLVSIMDTSVEDSEEQCIGVEISPPIIVEARKKNWSERLTSSTLFDPFLPDIIERNYEKVNKRTRERIIIK